MDGVESDLGPGTPVIADEYRGHITAVEVGGWRLGTQTDNPIVQARLLELTAFVLTGFGLLLMTGLISSMQMADWRLPSGPRPQDAQPADRTTALPLVLRPQAKNAAGHMMGVGTFTLGALLILPRLGDWMPLGFLFFGLCLVVYVAGRWLYLHNADIFVDELHVGKRDLFGRVTTLDRSVIQKMVLTMQEWTTRYGTRESRQLFLVGLDGRAWLRLNGAYWSPGDVEVLARTLGIRVEGSWGTPADVAAVRREVPGSFTWLEAHPVTTGLVLGILVIAVIVGAVVVAAGLQGQAS